MNGHHVEKLLLQYLRVKQKAPLREPNVGLCEKPESSYSSEVLVLSTQLGS